MKTSLAMLFALIQASAWATTYTFASGNYTTVTNFTACATGPCANYTTSMQTSGSFTTAAPLAANLANQNIFAQVTSFSLSDGIVTYSSADPNSRVYSFVVSTNAAGQITSSQIVLEEWQSTPHTPPSRVAILELIASTASAFNNTACTADTTSPAGVADTCTAAIVDASGSSAQSTVLTSNIPNVPTVGEWGLVCLAGCMLVLAWMRLRRRQIS